MHTQLFVAALLLGAPALLLAQQAPTCPLGTRLSLHVSSSINATGHEVYKMTVAQPAEDVPWSVQVAVEAPTCRDALNPLKYTTITLSHKTTPIQVPPSVPPPAAKKTLPEKYERIPNFGAYKFHAAGVTWLDANKTCTAEGAHLAIPDSAEEVKALLQLYTKHRSQVTGDFPGNGPWMHIGINDIDREGSWITVLGQPTTYQKWHTGEPNSGTAENCGAVHTTSGGFNDVTCHTWKFAFACELQLE